MKNKPNIFCRQAATTQSTYCQTPNCLTSKVRLMYDSFSSISGHINSLVIFPDNFSTFDVIPECIRVFCCNDLSIFKSSDNIQIRK